MPRSREQQAGIFYEEGAAAVRTGGHELTMLAGHLAIMIRGTPDYAGPLWPIRIMSDGQEYRIDRFIDYLREPPRKGLGLPSLYFLRQVLEASVEYGETALALVRAELVKEHIDFDKVAREEELKRHGERPEANDPGHPMSSKGDNIPVGTKSHRGTSAAHLAARLKRDFPEIAEQLAAGKFKSVRAAAIEAGIIVPLTGLDRLQKAWEAATVEQQESFLHKNSLTRKNV